MRFDILGAPMRAAVRAPCLPPRSICPTVVVRSSSQTGPIRGNPPSTAACNFYSLEVGGLEDKVGEVGVVQVDFSRAPLPPVPLRVMPSPWVRVVWGWCRVMPNWAPQEATPRDLG